MAPSVMHFAKLKILHLFKMTESGGVKRVIDRDAEDSEQIAFIQQHLKHEAEKFQRNFRFVQGVHALDSQYSKWTRSMPGEEESVFHFSLRFSPGRRGIT